MTTQYADAECYRRILIIDVTGSHPAPAPAVRGSYDKLAQADLVVYTDFSRGDDIAVWKDRFRRTPYNLTADDLAALRSLDTTESTTHDRLESQ